MQSAFPLACRWIAHVIFCKSSSESRLWPGALGVAVAEPAVENRTLGNGHVAFVLPTVANAM